MPVTQQCVCPALAPAAGGHCLPVPGLQGPGDAQVPAGRDQGGGAQEVGQVGAAAPGRPWPLGEPGAPPTAAQVVGAVHAYLGACMSHCSSLILCLEAAAGQQHRSAALRNAVECRQALVPTPQAAGAACIASLHRQSHTTQQTIDVCFAVGCVFAGQP